MTNDFTIYVMSHERSDDMATVRALRKSGYSGKIIVVVDDLDGEIYEYKEKIDEMQNTFLHVFSKSEVAKNLDLMDNFGALGLGVYARIAIMEDAKKNGREIYGIFDDDVTEFAYRYDFYGTMKKKPITNMDKVIKAMIEFLRVPRVSILSFQNDGGYFGGVNGEFKRGFGYRPDQTYFCKGWDIPFRGSRSDDEIGNAGTWRKGQCAYSIYAINHKTPSRGSNSGGMNADYAKNSMYTVNMYLVMDDPSSCFISGDKIKYKPNCRRPKILSEKVKNDA